MRLRYAIEMSPRVNTHHLPDDAQVTFAPMEVISDGLGGMDTSRAEPLKDLVSGSYNPFESGDILLAKVTPCFENGKKALVPELPNKVGFATSEVHVLRPDTAKIDDKFVVYVLSSRPFMFEGVRSMTGAGGLKRVSPLAVLDHRLVVTDIRQQREIATYLDRETRRIDDLIAEKGSFIALLREKRVAVISHAVTKGIDADAPMKPSGVEWIGDIPASWKLTKLGYLGRSANGINIGGDAFGTGYPFISYGDVYKNRQLPENVKGLVESSEQDRRTYSVRTGDVLFTRTSETIDEIAFPSVCMKNIPDAVFAGFLIRFRPYPGALVPSFSKYAFQNRAVRHYFSREMKLVTRASLSQGLLQSLPVPLPPIDVQQKVAAYLDQKEARFTELVSETEHSIALLKEKRAALITAAVTGKIDVRSAA